MIKHLAITFSILLLTCLGGTQASATTLGDIAPKGWPRFETDTSIKWQEQGPTGFKLDAKLSDGGNMFFKLSPTDSYTVTGGSYKLKANLDSSGSLSGGDLKITGSIAGLGITSSVLLTATLDKFAFDEVSGYTLAFNTTITGGEICSVIGCTPHESVWIDLDTGGFDPTLKNFKDTGIAITTIPVPAAIWLLGSGILGLAAVARRKRITT